MEQTALRERVLWHGGTAPTVGNRRELRKIAAQDELYAHVGEPIERRNKLDVKLPYLVDLQAVHIAGPVDYVSTDPRVGCAPACARGGAVCFRADVDLLVLGTQELNEPSAGVSFSCSRAAKDQQTLTL